MQPQVLFRRVPGHVRYMIYGGYGVHTVARKILEHDLRTSSTVCSLHVPAHARTGRKPNMPITVVLNVRVTAHPGMMPGAHSTTC